MSQTITIERGVTPGAVDFTKYIYSLGSVQMKKNQPMLWDLSVVKIDGLTETWFAPSRGDRVIISDTRWQAKYAGQTAGIVFSGFVTNTPEYEYLGVKAGVQCFGYKLQCTSDDYLINLKRLPIRTFINKSRGFILKSLLQEMFDGSEAVSLDLTHIQDGGIEQIFQTDQTQYWTDLAADFGQSDGYIYFVQDYKVFYVPAPVDPVVGSYSDVLDISVNDPRYTPSALSIKPVDNKLVNDLTVLGADEPTTACFEQFVSDGYQPFHLLKYIPFGIEESELLNDDLGSEDIDTSIWEEVDTVADYIQPFDGSLNVVGGPGTDTGLAYLRSRKGIEMTGVLNFRDGEIRFPPSPSGTGVIGGLYSAETCREADLFAGWYIDLGANTITPKLASGLDANSLTINPDFSYVLRRTITVDRFYGLASTVVDPETGFEYNLPPESVKAKILWEVEILDTTDPTIFKTKRQTISTTYTDCPDFLLYAAIVPYSCHLVMNNILIWKPQQAHVEVDTTPSEDVDTHIWTLGRQPVQVGSFIDGGVCAIVKEHERAKLAWYSTPLAAPALAEAPQEATTIPPRGSVISVRYYRNDTSKARVRSPESIADEKARFKDDGVRQLVMPPDAYNPQPRTSRECLYIARAVLADKLRTKYEGQYRFVTKESDPTQLNKMVYPGDRLQVDVSTADSPINVVLEVENVKVTLLAPQVYSFELEFGPVNLYDTLQREMIRERRSSLKEVAIKTSDAFDADTLNVDGYDPVPDPVAPTVNVIGPDYITVNFGTSMQPGITGYEVRETDSGWGTGGEVDSFTDYTRGLDRLKRELNYFVRSYRINPDASVSFSEKSAYIHHIFPLRNQIQLDLPTGYYDTETGQYRFKIPIPSDPDFATINVYGGGDLIYSGDGVNHIVKSNIVDEVFLSDGNIEIHIKDPDLETEDGTVVSAGDGGITELRGDVVAAGSGSQPATIAAGAVTETKLADEAVTNTKLANMAAATVKGRPVGAGTGDPQDLTANQLSAVLDTATDPFLRTSAYTASSLRTVSSDPASPADGDVWVRATGTSPTRTISLRVRDNGVTYTIAEIEL